MTDLRALENDLLFLINDVAHLMRRHVDRRARARGMTRAQWAVLIRLQRQPGMTQNELALLTDVEPITVGRLIDRLEASGFVERKADPNDRRIWRLRLTARAAPVLAEIQTFRALLHTEMSDGIDTAALGAATRCLKAIRANLSGTKAAKRKGVAR